MRGGEQVVARTPGRDGPGWRMAIAELGLAVDCVPSARDEESLLPLEVGVVGLSGVGKSSLLNALVSPGIELVPSGGVGPLTGAAVRIGYAAVATLRVRYVGRLWALEALRRLRGAGPALTSGELGRLSLACTGDQYARRDPRWLDRALCYALNPDDIDPPGDRAAADGLGALRDVLAQRLVERSWQRRVTDGAFFRTVHDHVAGRRAALCEAVEVGWPSPLLRAGLCLVDLPGLGASSDGYAAHTERWVRDAKALMLVTDRAGVADAVVTCLRRTGFLPRVAANETDLIGVVTKLDQVADDARQELRREDRAARPWSSHFRSVVTRAEALLIDQLGAAVRGESAPRDPGSHARALEALRVFGVSSREHQRIVARDDDDRPRVHLEESTGIPAVRRALIALARLRSSAWTSALFTRIRSTPSAAAYLSELLALVEMEGT